MTIVGAFAMLLILMIALMARNTSAVMYALFAIIPLNLALPEGVFYRSAPAMMHVAALAGVLLLCFTRGRSIWKLFCGDQLSKVVLLWYGAILLSFMNSAQYTPWAERTMVRFTAYMCFYFAVRGWMTKRAQLWKCWKIITYVIGICGVVAILQMAFKGPTIIYTLLHFGADAYPWEGRAYSLVSSGVNAYGGMLTILLPVEIALYANAPSWTARIWHGSVLALGMFGAIFSGSRGALAGIFSSILLACWYFISKKKTRLVVLLGLLLCMPLVLASVMLLSPRTFDVDKGASVYKRYEIWDQAWGMFRDHPVLGVGLGNFRENYDADKLSLDAGTVDTHNLYLQFLTETGVVGLLVYLWMCGELMRKGFIDLHRYSIGTVQHAGAYVAMAATLSVMIHGTVDVLYVGSVEFGTAFMGMMAITSRYEVLRGTERLAPARLAAS